ncbi:MAG TPA: DUF1206 domain-containing protein [Verrucomicrobiae bacterium]
MAGDAGAEAKKMVREWIEPVARIGYASKGAIYLLVGVLAVMAALNLGGSINGPKEALARLEPKAFGKVILSMICAGLACYSVWRFVQSFFDPDHKGKSAKGLAVRAGFSISGIVHAYLAVAVASIVLGNGNGGGGASEQGLTAKLMAQPLGIWLVGIVGTVFGGIAIFHIARGITGKFRKRLQFTQQSEKVRTVICRTCQFGLIARGITFLIIAWFFIRAAIHYAPNEAGGLREALGFVASQVYGPWLLVVLGLGMAAYGIYAFVEAKYRRIDV